MKRPPCVLLVGTADTKAAELQHLQQAVQRGGGRALLMDVGVLGPAGCVVDIGAAEVASAAQTTLATLVAGADEHLALQAMARGAARLAVQMQAEGQIDGLLVLGGTMGTDLGLTVAGALPLGCPKLLLSTIAHSHLLPPERIPPDLICMLWAGGLHGLNSLCRTALEQAAAAVLGACHVAPPAADARPMVGMTSLGGSVLRYMKRLQPALAERGYELAVFHTAGMGGQAFEALAAQGRFVAVMDFSLQELANAQLGSCVTAGPRRLLGAGQAGVPQLVAPGAADMVDFEAWRPAPAGVDPATVHQHNQLVASAPTTAAQRQALAAEVAQRLAQASGPVCLLLPHDGVDEWDRPGGPMHRPQAHAALLQALRRAVQPPVRVVEVPAHINDAAFCDAALQIFDDWVRDGRVPRGVPH